MTPSGRRQEGKNFGFSTYFYFTNAFSEHLIGLLFKFFHNFGQKPMVLAKIRKIMKVFFTYNSP